MSSEDDPWAGLAEDVGRALLLCAARLRAANQAVDGSRSDSGDRQARWSEDGLGSSQLKVLSAVRDAGATGITSHEVAKTTGLANSNTPRILKALAERGLVRAQGRPAIWKATRASDE